MRTSEPKTIHLKEYQVPAFLITKTNLVVQILEDQTRVTARLEMNRNAVSANPNAPLVLDGVELNTQWLSIDGHRLTAQDYKTDGEQLIISELPDHFVFESEVLIDPNNNTSLEGFYKSGGMLCTQCEAEGFRKITWYPDRPDVLSVFTVRLEADKAAYPVLLANGNPIEEGELEQGRHFAVWHDPFPKPSYLYAMVAGDLVRSDSEFVTCSGRNVSLRLFVEPHNADKTEFAHGALQRSMKWDEERFGREYDLDIYMIVASDYFNMGAMENKGLNVFNSARVLAKPETTTDQAFETIEAVIGHEYFHNWSGNRVTCRDWFQLSLKEGFTVFRDSEFTADLHSRAVKRIEDVTLLRTHQFAEDDSAMAHPVRPASYIEINNFYTMTVYEKGAEVVRMIYTLLGADMFRKGTDLYFERHDGEAATIEDFVRCMNEVSGFDFTQFMLWYDQAGTPRLDIEDQYLRDKQEYHLTIRQTIPPTPGQDQKRPMLIPVKMGLLGSNGQELSIDIEQSDQWDADTSVLRVTQEQQTFVFRQISEKPVPSLLRDFSAPVKLDFEYTREQLAFLMANDPNGFNRWESGQRLACDVILSLVGDIQKGHSLSLDTVFIESFGSVLANDTLDFMIKARMLTLPSEQYLFELMEVADVDAIHQAREYVKAQLADKYLDLWQAIYDQLNVSKVYEFSHQEASRRALKNLALGYLSQTNKAGVLEIIQHQNHHSDNHTDRSAAMRLLADYADENVRQQAYDEFIANYHSESLLVEFWFQVQASSRHCAVGDLYDLMESEYFDIRNPNKVRQVVSGFAMMNPTRFHALDGSGYQFIAEQIIRLNAINPQIAARLGSAFRVLPKLDQQRQALVRRALERILGTDKLSNDVYEVISRIAG